MSKAKTFSIQVQGTAIAIVSLDNQDFISLTDMAKRFGDDALIYNWMRNRNTLEFIGIWEQIHNPDFKGLEFETFKSQAGLNSFSLTPRKWIEATGAIGFQSRAGRYGGGTYAHRDIAFEFGSWLSPEFKLYLIKEFQRLKEDENHRLSLAWNLNRTLSKLNYRIKQAEDLWVSLVCEATPFVSTVVEPTPVEAESSNPVTLTRPPVARLRSKTLRLSLNGNRDRSKSATASRPGATPPGTQAPAEPPAPAGCPSRRGSPDADSSAKNRTRPS